MRYVDEHTPLPSCCLFCLPYPRRTRTAALTRFPCIARALLRRCSTRSRHTTHSPTTPHIAHALTRDCPRWLPSFYACNSVSSPFFRSFSSDPCASGRSLAPPRSLLPQSPCLFPSPHSILHLLLCLLVLFRCLSVLYLNTSVDSCRHTVRTLIHTPHLIVPITRSPSTT